MGLCKKLNCCNHKGSEPNIVQPAKDDSKKNGKEDDNATNKPDDKKQANGNVPEQTNDNGKPNADKEPIYATVQKKEKKPEESPAAPPVRAGFLVSFVVDSRGSAMTGNRGSGLRLIIPPGAVEQPVRVTCRFIRPQMHNLAYPPPLMERDALASGIIETGPSGAKFKLPVLIEVPYFASLGNGERELIVLRSEDGESWKEHSSNATFSDSGWDGEEGELYEDVVTSTDLNKVTDDLETGRIIRLSTTSFPKYFAVLSRIKGEVVTIGPEGGSVSAPSKNGNITVKFPPNALKKRIKIGLQLQNVPTDAINLIDTQKGIVDVYPLIGIYPRRRKFHHPMELSIPVISQDRCKEVKKVWIFCSLSSANERAHWEEVTENASVEVKGKRLVFETKVSALFWLISTNKDYEKDQILSIAQGLYKELTVSPYIARMTIFHREQFPYAWCDALRIYVAVNDRMDGYIEQKDESWTKVMDGQEIEVNDRSVYCFDCKDNLILATDCQVEAKLDDRFNFNAFNENSITLLVRWKGADGDFGAGSLPGKFSKTGHLVLKKIPNIPGASRRDAYQHSTWFLDARKNKEEELPMTNDNNSSEKESSKNDNDTPFDEEEDKLYEPVTNGNTTEEDTSIIITDLEASKPSSGKPTGESTPQIKQDVTVQETTNDDGTTVTTTTTTVTERTTDNGGINVKLTEESTPSQNTQVIVVKEKTTGNGTTTTTTEKTTENGATVVKETTTTRAFSTEEPANGVTSVEEVEVSQEKLRIFGPPKDEMEESSELQRDIAEAVAKMPASPDFS